MKRKLSIETYIRIVIGSFGIISLIIGLKEVFLNDNLIYFIWCYVGILILLVLDYKPK